MNFFDAMKELEKGNKVRNTRWKDAIYLYKDNELEETINLPVFVEGSMYKNMKKVHRYALRELGIDE